MVGPFAKSDMMNRLQASAIGLGRRCWIPKQRRTQTGLLPIGLDLTISQLEW